MALADLDAGVAGRQQRAGYPVVHRIRVAQQAVRVA